RCSRACCSLRSLLLRQPQRSTLFPYTTLFRSLLLSAVDRGSRHSGSQPRSVFADQPSLPELERRYIEWLLQHHDGNRSACARVRSEEHTSELQSRENLVCRLLLEKKKKHKQKN